MGAEKVQHWKHGWIPLDAYARAKAAGRGPTLAPEQYEAMRPTLYWSEGRREQMLDALRSTSSGRVLADTLASYQDGGSIARLRGKVEARLSGRDVDPTSAARVDALLGAIRDAPPGMAPPKLYRGTRASGTQEDVLGRYEAGGTIDMSMASFSSDRAVAKKFQTMTDKPGRSTRVMVELIGEKRALPIQDLPRDRRLWKEKEWVTAGRFRVLEAKKSPDGGVLVRVEQEIAL